MSNANDQVFLQAVILSPNGSLSIYDPLVVDAGTSPAANPVDYTPPRGSIVGIFGGGNGGQNVVVGPGSDACTSMAYQVFFCGTHRLLSKILERGIHIPYIGRDAHGKPCPTVRSFAIVDQDQSDNVQTLYLLTPDGRTAQDNATTRSLLPDANVIANGSDNTLISRFVDPAIGCSAWLLPDISMGGAPQPSQAANELQALYYQREPVALIPAGDPMVGPNELQLLNSYRFSVEQPTVDSLGEANTVSYCRHMMHIAPRFFSSYSSLLSASPSPDPNMNLHDFLVSRYQSSLQLLGCPQPSIES